MLCYLIFSDRSTFVCSQRVHFKKFSFGNPLTTWIQKSFHHGSISVSPSFPFLFLFSICFPTPTPTTQFCLVLCLEEWLNFSQCSFFSVLHFSTAFYSLYIFHCLSISYKISHFDGGKNFDKIFVRLEKYLNSLS